MGTHDSVLDFIFPRQSRFRDALPTSRCPRQQWKAAWEEQTIDKIQLPHAALFTRCCPMCVLASRTMGWWIRESYKIHVGSVFIFSLATVLILKSPLKKEQWIIYLLCKWRTVLHIHPEKPSSRLIIFHKEYCSASEVLTESTVSQHFS